MWGVCQARSFPLVTRVIVAHVNLALLVDNITTTTTTATTR
jgi:hypothetical protein